MSVFRVLRYLVLALALVAGGVAPGFAQDAHPAMAAQAETPCHGMNGELIDAASEAGGLGDCCEGGDCRCDCLQHSPASVVVLHQPASVAPGSGQAPLATASRAPARTLPATRPPIA